MSKKKIRSRHASSEKSRRTRRKRSAYPGYVITMIYNPLESQSDTSGQPDTDVLPFVIPRDLVDNREFIRTINRIQAKKLAIYYPDSFYLHFAKSSLRMKRSIRTPEVITLRQLARQLRDDATKLIAWCWYYAVQWVFLTDTMIEFCKGDFTEAEGLVIRGPDDEPVSVSTGITFDESVEGMFLLEGSTLQILFNPLYFDDAWCRIAL